MGLIPRGRCCSMLHLRHFRSPHVALHHHVEKETAHLNHLATSLFLKISHFATGPRVSEFWLEPPTAGTIIPVVTRHKYPTTVSIPLLRTLYYFQFQVRERLQFQSGISEMIGKGT